MRGMAARAPVSVICSSLYSVFSRGLECIGIVIIVCGVFWVFRPGSARAILPYVWRGTGVANLLDLERFSDADLRE